MDLWIRSQDRMILGNFNDIAIKTDSEDGMNVRGYQIVGYFDKNTEYETLGFYVTEERALEVLKEINDVKFYKYIASLSFNNFINLIQEYSDEEQRVLLQTMNTYEMPKE